MIHYGTKSKSVLATLSPKWQKVLECAAEITPAEYDFSLVEGYRSPQRQYQLFLEGKTQLDGDKDKSLHNYFPAEAVDIYPYLKGFGVLIPNLACYKDLLKYSNKEVNEFNMQRAEKFVISRMAMTSGFIFAAAEIEGVRIVMGTDWDRDGNMLDHNFQDYPHHQRVL